MYYRNTMIMRWLLILSLTFMGQSAYAATTHRLFVKTTPKDANVFIMNIQAKFHQGLALLPGKYDIIVSKPGYQKHRQWIEIREKDLTVSIALKALKVAKVVKDQKATEKEENPVAEQYTLNVNVVPTDANIHIMNITQKFSQGMLLNPGKYDLLVSKKGYPTRRQWIAIVDKDVQIDVILDKKSLAVQSEKNIASAQEEYALTVQTQPNDAIVQFVNTQKEFEQGLLLEPGKYLLRISKPGYLARQQWVKIIDKAVTVNISLSPPAECFLGEETTKEEGHTVSITRSVQLKFYEQLVEATYHANSMPSRQINHLEFKGVKKGNLLDLIALIDNEGKSEELKASMTLQGSKLLVDVGGSQHSLAKTNCH